MQQLLTSLTADVNNPLQLKPTRRCLFSRGTGSQSAGLGSVLDCACCKYYGVSTEEINERIVISIA